MTRTAPFPPPYTLLLSLLAFGCGEGITPTDGDGDGYTLADGDCWDAPGSPPNSTLTGADIYPGASETWYDGVDQNCDGVDDNDADADGYAATETGGGDCNDTDDTVNPGAEETWYDGVDSDCDEENDYDADGDGYEYDVDDCDDTDATIYPGADDTWYDGVDSDCGEENDYDADGDGYDYDATGGDDCNDSMATINPGAEEICGDGIDQDCEPDNCPGLSGELTASEADVRIVGSEASSSFGLSMASIGDWNNDGVSEILAGSPGVSGTDGEAYVFDSPIDTHSDVSSASFSAGAGLYEDLLIGFNVSSAAGFYGTGTLEVLVSLTGFYSGGGVVLLYNEGWSGDVDVEDNFDGSILGELQSGYFGYVTTSLGDADGDGYGEFLVSAPFGDEAGTNNGGAVYLFEGPFINDDTDEEYAYYGTASDAETLFYTTEDYANIGSSLAGVSDVNGDGLSDWVIGTPYASDAGPYSGSAYLFFGPHAEGEAVSVSSADIVFSDGTNSGGFASALAPYGDVDGDGNGDVGIASPYQNNGNGSVYVFTDLTEGAESIIDEDSAAYVIMGQGGNSLGSAVTFADLDDDDQDDIITSAAYDTEGKVYVLYATNSPGMFLSSDADVTITGKNNGDAFGRELLNAGDQNGDGVADLLIGASSAFIENESKGAIYLFAGATPGD